MPPPTAEHQRLTEHRARRQDWRKWGPYVSDRAWGTVREDYSADGEAWQHLPHDHARSRAYRWNEDGLAGVCDRFQHVCLAVALWNEQDAILKERLFGVSGPEGNHGEDVKEYYYYLDSTPTHSYMRMLYKYPQVAYPYAELVDTGRRRGRHQPELELVDLLRPVFQAGRYFDVFVEYAKADPEDVLCRIEVVNRGPEAAPVHVLPHLWFPINYLMIQTLRKYHLAYGNTLRIEVPRGSGRTMNLAEAADELRSRLTRVFLRDERTGRRAVFGDDQLFQGDPHFRDHILFYEYFHGDTGAGLGASHQTGWTALVARMLNGHDEIGMER